MDDEAKWNELKKRLKIGDEVEGKVVHKAPFGDFIDIGAGFHTLLEIIEMPELSPEKYREGNYNPIGSVIKAYVAWFNESPNKEIRLTQKPLHEWFNQKH